MRYELSTLEEVVRILYEQFHILPKYIGTICVEIVSSYYIFNIFPGVTHRNYTIALRRTTEKKPYVLTIDENKYEEDNVQ